MRTYREYGYGEESNSQGTYKDIAFDELYKGYQEWKKVKEACGSWDITTAEELWRLFEKFGSSLFGKK